MNKTPSSGRRISHKPKIGIVVCGFIDNRQFVTNAYIQSVRYSDGIPLILPLIRSDRILEEYLELCDGFLFCGGNDITPLLFGQEPKNGNGKTNITLDLFQIRLMKQLLRTEKPFLSICRGMQVINTAMGGTLVQHMTIPGHRRNDTIETGLFLNHTVDCRGGSFPPSGRTSGSYAAILFPGRDQS